MIFEWIYAYYIKIRDKYVTKEKMNFELGEIKAEYYLSFKVEYLTVTKINDRIFFIYETV